MRISDWSSDVCSSDLWKGKRVGWLGDLGGALPMEPGIMQTCEQALSAFRTIGMQVDEARLAEDAGEMWRTAVRSEEHTSGLQSLMRISYAVFCLKKKKNHN